jgi:hypothetical protein
MNKLMLELAEQAGFMVEDDNIYVGDMFDCVASKLQFFAELIIAECGEVADNSVDHGIPSADIDKHFGVE